MATSRPVTPHRVDGWHQARSRGSITLSDGPGGGERAPSRRYTWPTWCRSWTFVPRTNGHSVASAACRTRRSWLREPRQPGARGDGTSGSGRVCADRPGRRQAFLPVTGSIPGLHWCTTVWSTWTLTAPSAPMRDRAGQCGPSQAVVSAAGHADTAPWAGHSGGAIWTELSPFSCRSVILW
jgi:hypothetical protein